MLGAALSMLAIASSAHESVTVRQFALTTSEGQSIFHKDFDRRQLADVSDNLKLAFHAVGEKFQFEFKPSSVFADDATVKMTGNVRIYMQCSMYALAHTFPK